MTEYQKWIDERGAGDHSAMLFLRDILETAFNAGMTRAAEICRERFDHHLEHSHMKSGAIDCAKAIIIARDGKGAE